MGMSRDVPGLHVLDQRAVPRVAFGVDEDGPIINRLDEVGVTRVLAVVGDDGPCVQFFDPERNVICCAPRCPRAPGRGTAPASFHRPPLLSHFHPPLTLLPLLLARISRPRSELTGTTDSLPQ